MLAGEPVDVTMGHVNVIWQGDANNQALRALAHVDHAHQPAQRDRPGDGRHPRPWPTPSASASAREAIVVGQEAPTAWLNDASEARRLFGPPEVTLTDLIDWTADWLLRGGRSLGKPTHYETRDGQY